MRKGESMKRVQVWTEIPDDVELACDTLRVPREGDGIISGSGDLVFAGAGHAMPRVIVRPAWQWPSWLLCDWVAQNKSGRIAMGCGDPILLSELWSWSGCGRIDFVDSDLLAINLPPCTDWKQSLRLNPNVK